MDPFLLNEPFCFFGCRFGKKLKLSPKSESWRSFSNKSTFVNFKNTTVKAKYWWLYQQSSFIYAHAWYIFDLKTCSETCVSRAAHISNATWDIMRSKIPQWIFLTCFFTNYWYPIIQTYWKNLHSILNVLSFVCYVKNNIPIATRRNYRYMFWYYDIHISNNLIVFSWF